LPRQGRWDPVRLWLRDNRQGRWDPARLWLR